MAATVYMVKCSDGSFYVGSTRATLEGRLAEHNAGKFDGYTATRRPVVLVWSQEFQAITDAVAAERRLKGWCRAKKAALIAGDFTALRRLSKRGKKRPSSLERSPSPVPQNRGR